MKTKDLLTKSQIIVGLEFAYSLIKTDENFIEATEQKIKAERLDSSYPEEAKPQLEESLKRYLVLSDFLEHDFENWCNFTIKKLKAIECINDIDDREFFRAMKVEFDKLDKLIKNIKNMFKVENIKLDTVELHSLAFARKIFGHQQDAMVGIPTDVATLIRLRGNF